MRKLLLTALVGVVLLLATGTTAQATVLRLPHKPFSKMTVKQKVHYLKRQKWHDNSIIRWYKNNRDLASTDAKATSDVRWARKSLVIVKRNLRKLNTVSVVAGGSVQQIICRVFGSQCAMALRVAYRESRYSIHAINGQYYGLFQMGSSERSHFATIGYSTAYEQTVAAHNYYLVSGWSPWSQTAW